MSIVSDAIIEIYLARFTVCKVYPESIVTEIEQPNFPHLIQKFIYNQQHPNNISNANILPTFYGKITIYISAIATFYAPSDISGVGGMHCECIHAVKSWRKGPAHYDTIFVNTNSSLDGMQGLDVAHVRLFFSFSFEGIEYPCTLMHWLSCMDDSPDDHTGMWVVQPDDNSASIIHLDTIFRASHLLPVFG